MAVANQYEVGRCDVSLVHNNSDPCSYVKLIRFSLKMENNGKYRYIHFQVKMY